MTQPFVVIIEDDVDLADIYSATLEGAGFSTKIIHDGAAAMLQLSRLHPDLIVLDLGLPHYSGGNIFEYIRSDERIKDVWVILATADATQAAALREMEHENAHLVTLIKPLSVAHLRQLATKLVSGK